MTMKVNYNANKALQKHKDLSLRSISVVVAVTQYILVVHCCGGRIP
jgi:hypothetical protein